jgi:RNA polymerase primary sigma factor
MRFDEPGLQAYFKEINQFPLLTAAEEVDLANRVRRRDHEARDRMIRSNLRLVVHLAAQYARRGAPLMDLIAEGNIGLMKAVERFDPGRHTRFSTYATWWIRQHIRRALQTCGPTVRVPGYMVELVARWRRATQDLTEKFGRHPPDEEVAAEMKISRHRMRMISKALHAASTTASAPDMSWVFEGTYADDRIAPPDQELIEEADRMLIKRCLEALTEREKQVIQFRYGLYAGEPMTLEKIGERLGLTRERIRQVESQALRKLAVVIGKKAS